MTTTDTVRTFPTSSAASDNGKGVVGVAWRVRIMALKFLNNAGNGNNSDAIKCIDYAIAKGAHIINASWGGGGFSSSVSAAITRARNAGILFVAAAGNGGSDNIGDNNNITPFYPSSYPHDNIIAVASTDRNDNRSTFSNYGSSIYSTVHNSDTTYSTRNGTSMAARHVAAAAALLKRTCRCWTIPKSKTGSCPRWILSAASPASRFRADDSISIAPSPKV
jgi:subtilisin family serine protease